MYVTYYTRLHNIKHYYTPCLKKTSHLRLAIILTYRIRLQQFLAETLLRKQGIIRRFVVPSHLSSASALSCKTGNPEDSTLVHCACNTVQLLQHYQLPFSWTMPQQSLWLNALITRLRESYSSMSMSRESKNWRNQAAGWIHAMH